MKNITVKEKNTIEIRSLTGYTVEGYNFKLMNRQGDIALFQQFTFTEMPVAYEIIIVQRNKKKEYPPKTEDWGKLGWSFSTLEVALKKFNEICSHVQLN